MSEASAPRIYPGWLVVLAAYCGAMVSFGSLLVFTFSIFSEASERRIRMEPRIGLGGVRIRGADRGGMLAAARATCSTASGRAA
jgi:hypothetical protein